MFDRSRYTILKEAVNALGRVCDGALEKDDQGFDGSDTRAGHLYAFLPLCAWPLSAFHRVWGWTKKYHRQLELMQIDCASLPEPPLFEGEDRQIALLPDNTGFFVIFPYDEEIIAAFRGIPTGQTHTVRIGTSSTLSFRYRTVKAVTGAGRALLAFAEEYQFQVDPLAADFLRRDVPQEGEEELHEYRVILEAGGFALYFPRIPALNEEVKRIPGRKPSSPGGFHWVIPAQSAAALLAFLQRHPQFFIPPDVASQISRPRK
jgi:hypothetical protein